MEQNIETAIQIAKELRKRERFNKIDFYDPYPYQQEFHETGVGANQRLLMAWGRRDVLPPYRAVSKMVEG